MEYDFFELVEDILNIGYAAVFLCDDEEIHLADQAVNFLKEIGHQGARRETERNAEGRVEIIITKN